jgi:hypothetical protein
VGLKEGAVVAGGKWTPQEKDWATRKRHEQEHWGKKRKNGDTPIGYEQPYRGSNVTDLIKALLGKGSVNTFQHKCHATIWWKCFPRDPCHTTLWVLCFMHGPCRVILQECVCSWD